MTLPFRIQDGSAAKLKLCSNLIQQVFAFRVEDLTLSGKSMADVADDVAWDYAYRLPLITAALTG